MNDEVNIDYERKRNLYLLILIFLLIHWLLLYIFFNQIDQVKQARSEINRDILPILNYIQEPEEPKPNILNKQQEEDLMQKISQIAHEPLPPQKEIATMRQRGGMPVPIDDESVIPKPIIIDPTQAGNPIEDKTKFFEDGVGIEEETNSESEPNIGTKPEIESIKKAAEIEKKAELGIITQTDEPDGDKQFMQLEEFKISEKQKIKPKNDFVSNTSTQIDKNLKNKTRPKRPTRRWILAKEHKAILPTVTSGLLGESLGNDPINWKGNDSLIPDLEQMRQASYIQKIHQFMQTAYIVKYPSVHFHIANPPLTMQISIKIDKNGKIISAKKLLSSGSEEIDDFVIDKVIPYAGPFPPIPKHLNLEVFEYNPIMYIYN